MAAAYLTLTIQEGNRRKCVQGYANDTQNALVTFDQAKIPVAGSPSKISQKVNGHIVDVLFTSDLATPTHIQFLVNNQPTGDILDVTAQLASVENRAKIALPVQAGSEISIIQL